MSNRLFTKDRDPIRITVPTNTGNAMSLADVITALVMADLPADAEVTAEDFKRMIPFVDPLQIQRDSDGVYILLVQCRVRMIPADTPIPPTP